MARIPGLKPLYYDMTEAGAHRHLKRYFNEKVFQQHSGKIPLVIRLKKVPTHNLSRGDTVHVTGVQNIDNVLHLNVEGFEQPLCGKYVAVPSCASRWDKEESARELLSQLLEDAKNGQEEIWLETPHGITRAAAVVNIEGWPRADMAIVDRNGTPTYFISHKDYKHQQYCSLNGTFDTQPMQQFIADVKRLQPDGMQPKMKPYERNVDDELFTRIAIFGPDCVGYQFGINNVHVVMRGTFTIEQPEWRRYVLSCDAGFYKNTSNAMLPKVKLQARYTWGTGTKAGCPNTRFLVMDRSREFKGVFI